jgi:hypothetical protein
MGSEYNRRSSPCSHEKGCLVAKRLRVWRVRYAGPYRAFVRGKHVMRYAKVPGGPWCWTCARDIAERYSRDYGQAMEAYEVAP